MIKYNVLQSTNDIQLNVQLTKENLDVKNINLSDEVNINPIQNVEKESYMAGVRYNLEFLFYGQGMFKADFTNAGFSFPKDTSKNVFKKSSFVMEFYEQGETFTWLGSTTISVLPRLNVGKGPIIEDNIPVSKFSVSPTSDLRYLYGYRDFSMFKDKIDESTARIYAKVLFQNALTGKRHYFVKSDKSGGKLRDTEFTKEMFYHEMRFFDDFSYSFYDGDILLEDVFFKELVVTSEPLDELGNVIIKPVIPPYVYIPPPKLELQPYPVTYEGTTTTQTLMGTWLDTITWDRLNKWL